MISANLETGSQAQVIRVDYLESERFHSNLGKATAVIVTKLTCEAGNLVHILGVQVCSWLPREGLRLTSSATLCISRASFPPGTTCTTSRPVRATVMPLNHGGKRGGKAFPRWFAGHSNQHMVHKNFAKTCFREGED